MPLPLPRDFSCNTPSVLMPNNTIGWLARAAVVLILWSIAACGSPSGAAPPPAPSPDPQPQPPAPAPPPAVGAGDDRVLTALVPAEMPDLTAALATNRSSLVESLERSLSWFEKPSTHNAFPVSAVSHEWARASVFAFRELLLSTESLRRLAERIAEEFELHASVGSDGRGTVLFTGYFSPAFDGSRVRTQEYRYPLYRRPADLVTDPATGDVLGRRVADRIVPYPARAELEASGALAGLELVWLRDLFDAYLIQVQGSASISLPDGSTMHIGFDGSNGRPYTSISLALLADGKLKDDEISLPEVRDYFRSNPTELPRYLHLNERFIFFREDSGGNWPTGSLGVRVTPMRSLATDKSIFPPGAVVLVETRVPDRAGGTRRLQQFMLDQDSGGAMKSPGRADIYYGIGPIAESLAGGQYSEGRLYYVLLRPERLRDWLRRMGASR